MQMQSKSLLDRKHCVGILQLSAGLLADHASSEVLNCKHRGQMATAVIMQAGRDNGGLQRDVDRRSQSTWCFALHCIEWDQMQAAGGRQQSVRTGRRAPGAKPQPDSLHLSPPKAPCCQHQHRMGPYSSIKLNCKHGGQVASAQRDVEATWCTYNHI